MSKKATSNILLLLTAIIWGSSFVAQKAGTVLEPFTYNGIRTLIGGLALLPVILITSRRNPSPPDPVKKRKTLAGGIACGICLALASNLQQFGMYFDTGAGKAAFITALYIMIVPIIGLLVVKRSRAIIWICAVIGAIGFYLLTMAGTGESFHIQKGDFFLLLCAVAFSCHILTIDHFSPNTDGIMLSCIQFLVAGLGTIILMLIFEHPDIHKILDCWFPIIYAGVFSCGIAYTLQVVGQKNAQPAAASLILSLESVFSVLFSALLLHERMSGFEITGCIVIFAAVIISQIPERNERIENKRK